METGGFRNWSRHNPEKTKQNKKNCCKKKQLFQNQTVVQNKGFLEIKMKLKNFKKQGSEEI